VLNTAYIPMKTQHMLCFSGLRGAVAFACAQNFPDEHGNRKNVLLRTMLVVLASVFTLGSTTDKMLMLLNIEVDVDESK
jgi:sodium/hydrogen exchanger 8